MADSTTEPDKTRSLLASVPVLLQAPAGTAAAIPGIGCECDSAGLARENKNECEGIQYWSREAGDGGVDLWFGEVGESGLRSG